MKKLGLGLLSGISLLLSNTCAICAYNGSQHANLSGGMMLLFVPLMLGIIYLAKNDEA